MYTGNLPDVDALQALPLAHRLALQGCVASCAVATDRCDPVKAVQVLVLNHLVLSLL